jgi:hypothetical protein
MVTSVIQTLLKLHEPYLKLYIEEFYKQMKKTCVETLMVMFVHYEGALQVNSKTRETRLKISTTNQWKIKPPNTPCGRPDPDPITTS